jgi:hypothetical protein
LSVLPIKLSPSWNGQKRDPEAILQQAISKKRHSGSSSGKAGSGAGSPAAEESDSDWGVSDSEEKAAADDDDPAMEWCKAFN